MKKLMFLSLVMIAISARSQVTETEPVKTGHRYYVGVSYSYMSFDQKLSALSLHSEWYGEDFGTHDLNSQEINEVNAVIDRNTRINNVNLEAGMSFINNPESKWHFKGRIYVGIAGNYTRIDNNSLDTLEFSFDSGLSKPAFGLGFDAGYHFNTHWALSLKPLFMGTIGKNTEIVDNLNPEPENITQSSEDEYNTFYEHLSLMADFTAGSFTISLGPGFYWINSRHIYTINRTNDLNGDVMIDKITSKTTAKSFIDGSVAVEWKIIEPLTFSAIAGIGPDLFLNTGLHYNF